MPDHMNTLIQQLNQKLPELDGQGAKALSMILEEIRAEGCRRQQPKWTLVEKNPVYPLEEVPRSPLVACAGMEGAYAHLAALRMFEKPEVRFFPGFDEVFQAVVSGETDFGLLPVENSSAGSVHQVYELVPRHQFYINYSYSLKVDHCLAARPGVREDEITAVYSHMQALAQCSRFLKEAGLRPVEDSNTAVAAKRTAGSDDPIACICSRESAAIYNLAVLREGVQNSDGNYTRFVCISRKNYVCPRADTIAVAVQTPHEAGSLNRLLTRFSLCDLNLVKLLSMPLGKKDFRVVFHLEFKGNIMDKRVVNLLSYLYEEFAFFKYYGNYRELE